MRYNDMIALNRGDKVGEDTVLWVGRRGAGGVGMGEYPAEVVVVFASGEVRSADEWTGASRVVHRRLA